MVIATFKNKNEQVEGQVQNQVRHVVKVIKDKDNETLKKKLDLKEAKHLYKEEFQNFKDI